MSFTGMDVSAVRALASQMTNSAGEIQNLMHQMTSQLQSASWVGPDRERFVGEWQGTYVPALNNVVNALHKAAQVANQRAAAGDGLDYLDSDSREP